MKASKVKLRELKSFSDCMAAIDAIESDYLNVVGGIKAWNSGYRTYLTKTAEDKVEAIKRRADRLSPPDEDV